MPIDCYLTARELVDMLRKSKKKNKRAHIYAATTFSYRFVESSPVKAPRFTELLWLGQVRK